MIKNQTYNLKHVLLTNELLDAYINNFWNDVFSSIGSDKHLLLMCKVQYSEAELGYRTLGHLRKVNIEDKELFIEYLSERLGIFNDAYVTLAISKITFSYVIKEGLAAGNRRLLQDLSDKSVTTHRFNNLNLPISMNPSDYGNVLLDNYIQTSGVNLHRFIVENGKLSYIIDISSDELINKVRIQGPADLQWTDTKISDDVFKREIGKSIIFFMGGEIVLRKKVLSAKPFRKQSKDKDLESDFVTMDIETITQEGNLVPYLICAFNGKDYITSYANDPLVGQGNVDPQKALFSSFINQLTNFFNKDRKALTVYAHNLSGFDGIFLMKHLLSFGKVVPLLFNGKLMSIKVNLNIEGFKGKTIVFKDSYLLLPMSLRQLCLAFDITAPKGFFPFLMTTINYIGELPQFKYWKGINSQEYDGLLSNYTNKLWSFKEEAIKYCKLDCQCLHEILVKFNELIFNEFNVNIYNSLTLPSLAMRIYKSQFMPKNTIYQLLGTVEQNIRESYTGARSAGAVDVYIPHNRVESFFSKIFNKLYYYDVNSLYPTIMAKTPMPVGKPIYFEGDIRNFDPQAFGFFYCKITSPDNLLHPILQRRIKTSEGIRTIAGLGSWEGYIFSGEMDNAVKFGYQFEILKGYEFKKGNIFSDYVNKMYELRLQYVKGHPMNLIAKLLMNSLYGKFGMKLESTVIEMFNTSNETENNLFKDMLEAYGETLQDFIQLDDHYLTVRKSMLNYKYNEDDDLYHGLEVNIAVASSITAGARMWMSFLKNNPKFNLYYSDTDSAIIDKPLPDFMVGGELGQFKLEHTIDRAVFLAPKVYGLVTVEGEEVIKVKGVTKEQLSDIHIQDLENLLIKDSTREFNQSKWFKKVIEGEIAIEDVAYTLKVTSNKRQSVYVNNIFNSTKPFNYDDILNN
jgi:hypothetical protein